jgi:hypothetical protein
MSLLFGNMSKDAVDFSSLLTRMQAGEGETGAQLATVAANFRRATATSAFYLVFIGRSSCFHFCFPFETDSFETYSYRCCFFRVHLRLHVHLAVHGRNQR